MALEPAWWTSERPPGPEALLLYSQVAFTASSCQILLTATRLEEAYSPSKGATVANVSSKEAIGKAAAWTGEKDATLAQRLYNDICPEPCSSYDCSSLAASSSIALTLLHASTSFSCKPCGSRIRPPSSVTSRYAT